MVRALEKINPKDVVFIDIETVSSVKELEVGTPLHAAWAYKSRYQNELTRKSGEEVTMEEYYKEKAALYATFGKVVCITVGRIVKDSKIVLKSYAGEDEAELLRAFNSDLTAVLSKNPQTVLCGLNNIGFDEPYLYKRLIINQIKPMRLLDSSGLKPWEVGSIDLGKIFQGSSFYPDSLVAIATALGLPSPKDGIDGSMVTEYFYNGRLQEIVYYCERDVVTTANIFRKLRFEEEITEIEVKEDKEVEAPAPFLQRLYMSKDFKAEEKAEIQLLVKGVKDRLESVEDEDRKNLIGILLSVYIDKKDKVADKKTKKTEVEEFVKSL